MAETPAMEGWQLLCPVLDAYNATRPSEMTDKRPLRAPRSRFANYISMFPNPNGGPDDEGTIRPIPLPGAREDLIFANVRRGNVRDTLRASTVGDFDIASILLQQQMGSQQATVPPGSAMDTVWGPAD